MKKLTALFSLLCLTLALTVPASALEYDIDGPGDPEYGKDTSIEVIHTADGGAMKNEDVSKNAALIPPAFGSPSAYTLNTGTPLTPNLAPGYMLGEGAAISRSNTIITPPDFGGIPSVGTTATPGTSIPNTSILSTGYTEVTSDLYYKAGKRGRGIPYHSGQNRKHL